MTLCCTPRIERITQAVTGRAARLCAVDTAIRGQAMQALVAGRRVLVVGGAGSIGSATVLELLRLQPAAIAVLDTNENNLAELVRTIRSSDQPWSGALHIQPVDYGSPLAARWLAGQAPFDLVLSFAALKHVRSERDAWSLARMLEVNLLKADRFLTALRSHGHGRRGVFFVSTDKAANPVSLMGASKRAMELLLWSHSDAAGPMFERVTTTRFANVAFSDGSLPWGFLQRLEKRQPLACPGDVKRYLVSPGEAGQLCLLAALMCPHRHVLVPRLDPARDLVTFTAIAEHTLRDHGLEPAWYEDEATARAAVAGDLARRHYPVLVTRSDTNGEKDEEEFVGQGETARDIGLSSAQVIAAPAFDDEALHQLLATIAAIADHGQEPVLDLLVEALARLVPTLQHKATGKSLDGKM